LVSSLLTNSPDADLKTAKSAHQEALLHNPTCRQVMAQ